jgi:hypothetical protein
MVATPLWVEAQGVTVNKAAPTVGHRMFDPKRPPRDIPTMVPGEAGLAHYEYTLSIGAGGDTEVLSPNEVNVTINGVDIDASLPITIWLENNTPQRIIDHENGHMAIIEYYYANIEVYAKRAGQSVIGKKFHGTGRDRKTAENDAIDKAIKQINDEILTRTRVRAVACNDRYDKTTDHGRNPGSQADAAAKAEADDPEPPGGKPAPGNV